MHLRIDINSPHTVDDIQSMNTLFLNSTTVSNIQIIEGVYQSILTSIPIKRGKIFNIDYESVDKPKLGNTVRRIHLTTNLIPMVMSSISELEDLSGGVGVRFKIDHLALNLVYAQHNTTKLSSLIEESQQKRKAVSKWNVESMQLTFSGLEARVLTLLRKDNANMTESIPDYINQWVFPEDLNFVDNYSDMEMTPFLW